MFTSILSKALCLAVLVILLSFDPAVGQNTEESRATLSGIGAVSLYIDSLSVELVDAGITPYVINADLVRILKEQGIAVVDENTPAEPGSPTLYIEVVAALQDSPEIVAFSIRLELMQAVLLERSPDLESRLVSTWSTGGLVLYGKGWREALLADVVIYAEEFAEAYWESNPDRLEQ